MDLQKPLDYQALTAWKMRGQALGATLVPTLCQLSRAGQVVPSVAKQPQPSSHHILCTRKAEYVTGLLLGVVFQVCIKTSPSYLPWTDILWIVERCLLAVIGCYSSLDMCCTLLHFKSADIVPWKWALENTCTPRQCRSHFWVRHILKTMDFKAQKTQYVYRS